MANKRDRFTKEIDQKIRDMSATHSSSQIARALGLKAKSVAQYCHRVGIRLRQGAPRSDVTIHLGEETYLKIAIEAKRRGTIPPTLVGAIVQIIARDGIFDAILAGEMFDVNEGGTTGGPEGLPPASGEEYGRHTFVPV